VALPSVAFMPLITHDTLGPNNLPMSGQVGGPYNMPQYVGGTSLTTP
jgi:hypothetical protein